MKLSFELECPHIELNDAEMDGDDINEMIAYRISHLLSELGRWDTFQSKAKLVEEVTA